MKIIKKKNENSLISAFIENFESEILKKKKNKKRLSFVLTGGNSPKKLYAKLAGSNIDWSVVDFFWGDERFVSRRSKDSNFKLANDLLIKKIKIIKKNIFSINTEKLNIRSSCIKYDKKNKNYFKYRKIKFDIFLLGMGNDGHIASIFPNSDTLKKKFISKPIIRKDFERITLGINIINDSKKIFLWLNNKSKAILFHKLLKKGKEIPVNNLNKKKLTCFKVS